MPKNKNRYDTHTDWQRIKIDPDPKKEHPAFARLFYGTAYHKNYVQMKLSTRYIYVHMILRAGVEDQNRKIKGSFQKKEVEKIGISYNTFIACVEELKEYGFIQEKRLRAKNQKREFMLSDKWMTMKVGETVPEEDRYYDH